MDAKIEAILLFIQDNFDKSITLKEFSVICNTNYCYLASAFKKKTGMSFPLYVKSLKIESAKTLLKESLLEIKEISYKLGYKSLTHFYQDFKLYVGIPPKEYRKKYEICFIQKYSEKLQNIFKVSK